MIKNKNESFFFFDTKSIYRSLIIMSDVQVELNIDRVYKNFKDFNNEKE